MTNTDQKLKQEERTDKETAKINVCFGPYFEKGRVSFTWNSFTSESGFPLKMHSETHYSRAGFPTSQVRRKTKLEKESHPPCFTVRKRRAASI